MCIEIIKTYWFVYNFVSATYFYPIVEFLVKNFSYVRGQNVRGAPYDFRKAPSESVCWWSNVMVAD